MKKLIILVFIFASIQGFSQINGGDQSKAAIDNLYLTKSTGSGVKIAVIWDNGFVSDTSFISLVETPIDTTGFYLITHSNRVILDSINRAFTIDILNAIIANTGKDTTGVWHSNRTFLDLVSGTNTGDTALHYLYLPINAFTDSISEILLTRFDSTLFRLTTDQVNGLLAFVQENSVTTLPDSIIYTNELYNALSPYLQTSELPDSLNPIRALISDKLNISDSSIYVNHFQNDTAKINIRGEIPLAVSDLNNDLGFITSPNDADFDPTNEIQDLSLSVNTLSLSGDGTTVDLSGYLDNTDTQDLSISNDTIFLVNGNYVKLPAGGADNQTLSIDSTAERDFKITILGGNSITFSDQSGSIAAGDTVGLFHSNRAILDATTASFTTAKDNAVIANTGKDTTGIFHSNRSILDATTASFTTTIASAISSNTGKDTTGIYHSNRDTLNATTRAFTVSMANAVDQFKHDSASYWQSSDTLTFLSTKQDLLNLSIDTFACDTTIEAGQICILTASGMKLAKQTDSLRVYGLIAVALESAVQGNTGKKFITRGVITTSGLTRAQTWYLDTTAGAKTTTKPSTVNNWMRILGYSKNSTQFFFNPDNVVIKLK